MITESKDKLQNNDIFCLASLSNFFQFYKIEYLVEYLIQASSFTECWVGLVLNSFAELI